MPPARLPNSIDRGDEGAEFQTPRGHVHGLACFFICLALVRIRHARSTQRQMTHHTPPRRRAVPMCLPSDPNRTRCSCTLSSPSDQPSYIYSVSRVRYIVALVARSLARSFGPRCSCTVLRPLPFSHFVFTSSPPNPPLVPARDDAKPQNTHKSKVLDRLHPMP